MATKKKTRRISGFDFIHDSCSTNQGALEARKTKLMKQGKKVRILKSGTRLCLYTR